ncbi:MULTISPECIES: transposase [Chryseobacterium]|uniref:Transposase n=1 Tax=Chryseobacterium camelliae TaxID=1265445 RepID=A0ABU0TIN9_9FLAO|nr:MULTISPECIES: transposase [Chryseobacterium]MDT3409210.1 transposase [Pseudacidovorax intermedius]MDQ1096929.1 transposase [Chryseobacterium camelliae]MDQ1100871.1 transposase [Chryseobacterium sp. SORGH_AS_1048]MDR6084313.1 transposase [Chryseobacterium sp. SORGH_AS_0909]MDR6132584.1 transposase [Chryseobacterium sp. SORGH_AS_1175]
MENNQENRYLKRTQKDYSVSLKLQIVQEIETGGLSISEATRTYGVQSRKTVVEWLRKFGNFDWENQNPSNMPKSPEQKIMELEAQVKLLEKQKALLERQAFVADNKAIIFDMMIDIAEQEYKIDIRKNLPPEQSTILKKKNNKQ